MNKISIKPLKNEFVQEKLRFCKGFETAAKIVATNTTIGQQAFCIHEITSVEKEQMWI